MKRALFIVVLMLTMNELTAQKITIPELWNVLDLSRDRIDTLMKQKSYRLLEKETDTGALQLYYSNLERNPEGPDWVRSVTYTELSVNQTKSRLIVYRTYRKKEYQEIMEWLLNNNFKTIKRENFGISIHSIYDDGSRTILVKQVKQKLPSGANVWSYEFELGK